MNIVPSKLSANETPAVQEDAGNFRPDVKEDDQTLLKRYLTIALKRRWTLIASVGACVLLGLIVTLLMTPQYTAKATIEISRESDQVTGIAQVEREANIADQEFYQTQYGLLRSRSLAERVATSLRLVDDPEFFEMFDAIDEALPAFQINNGRFTSAGRDVRRRFAGEILLDHLGVDPARLSRLVEINFSSPDPVLSARIANGWAENFIESNLERKVQASSYGRRVLQKQLTQYKERLDDSQRQLVNFASNQQIINLPSESGDAGVSSSERSIVVDDLAALNMALNDATADRIGAEAKFRRAGSDGSSPQALGNSAINNLRQKRAEISADLEELLVRFEPGYPTAKALQTQIDTLDRAIAREENRVENAVEAEYEQAVAREAALKNRVDSLKEQYLDMRRRSIQYNIFQQEVDTNRALYDGLLQRFKEIGVAAGIGVNNVSIVDAADIPTRPSSPRLILNLLLSLIAGGLIGAAIALGLEQLDESISDPSELQRSLGLALLGTVPKLDENKVPRDELLDRKSQLVDAYISVRTGLSVSTKSGVPRSFAVTSTRPAEGKSTTSLALATTLARSGKKVALVDGDMRSPSVHVIGGVGHERGLSNFLSGDDDIKTMMFPMRDLEFMAMSAGPIPPNAAELLTGNRLSELVEQLLQHFDHVIIDSPPVMGLADALLIGRQVEGVVYAVESHGIRSGQVRAALERLTAADVTVLGGVLTKFEAAKAYNSYGYTYGYNYGREDSTPEAV